MSDVNFSCLSFFSKDVYFKDHCFPLLNSCLDKLLTLQFHLGKNVQAGMSVASLCLNALAKTPVVNMSVHLM